MMQSEKRTDSQINIKGSFSLGPKSIEIKQAIKAST
jgi:hypothetical protein